MRCYLLPLSAMVILAGSLNAQGATQQKRTVPEDAAARESISGIKRLYFGQDMPGLDSAAAVVRRRFSTNAEARAWSVVALQRAGRDFEARTVADSLARAHPASIWSSFARAFTLVNRHGRESEAITVARALYDRAPSNRDVIWLYAYVLNQAGKHGEAAALVDSVRKRLKPWAELLVAQGEAFARLRAPNPSDTVYRAKVIAAFAEARHLDSTNFNAHYLGSSRAANTNDSATITLLQRARQLSPGSLSALGTWFSRTRARRDLTAQQKDSIIRLEVERLLATRSHMPGALYLAAEQYGMMKVPATERALQERVLAEFPNSIQAEYIVQDRIRAANDSARNADSTSTTYAADTARLHDAARRMVAEYVSRPIHRSGSVFMNLLLDHYFNLKSDSTISGDSLRVFGDVLVEHNRINLHLTHYDLPILVAERKGDLRWAARVVRQGLTLRRADAERDKAFIVQREGVGGYADYLDRITAHTHNAFGAVYLYSGRLDQAQRELERSRELNRQDPSTYFYLGKVAEARDDSVEAQASYARGLPLESSFTGRRNTNALKKLYAATNGSLDGFDTFVERLKEEDRQRRREKIGSERVADGKDVPRFNLERYAANRARFSNDSLKGKIAVVNFWGVWCGPCVKEIPDIQKFHETVKNDTSVMFLTVDYNDTPEVLHEFMTKRKLTFPVLLDENRWVMEKAVIMSFPTTWFIDRDGKIAFSHRGASDVVLEEFLWRVEMLKAAPAKP